MTAYLAWYTTRSLDDPQRVMRDLIAFIQPSRVLSAWIADRFDIPPCRKSTRRQRYRRVLEDGAMSTETRNALVAAAEKGQCVTAVFVSPLARRLTDIFRNWGEQTGLGRFEVQGFYIYIGKAALHVSQYREESFALQTNAAVLMWGDGAVPDPNAANQSILQLPAVREITEGLEMVFGGAPDVLVWWDSPYYEIPMDLSLEREPTAMEKFLAPINADDEEIPMPASVFGKCHNNLVQFNHAFEELCAAREDASVRSLAIAVFAEALADLLVCNAQIEARDRDKWVKHIHRRVARNILAL